MVLAGIASCSNDPPDGNRPLDPIGQSDQELSATFAERAIPLRFVRLYTYATPANDGPLLFSWIQDMVQVANQVFRPAGVQFFIASWEDCSVGDAAFGDIITAAPPGIQWNSVYNFQYGWLPAASVGLTCAFPGKMDPGLGNKVRGFWLDWAAVEWQDPSQVVIWLHRDSSHNGVLPYAGRGVHILATESLNGAPRRWVLAHELGHTLGAVSHTDDWGDVVNNVLPHPVHPETGQRFRMSDMWDMAYEPGSDPATDPNVYFSNRTAAYHQEVDLGHPLSMIHVRDAFHASVGACGQVTAQVDGSGFHDTLTVPDARLRGIGAAVSTPCAPPGSYSFVQNVMAMIPEHPPADAPPNYYAMLSDAQVALIRSYLRYESAITDGFAGHVGSPHGRTRLGRWANREPAYKLDFDGDQRRDIGWWEPPTTPGTYGTFRVLLSTYNFSTTAGQSITASMGRLGDIPIPGDYNGDGRTDLAVFRPGGGTSGTDPADATGRWYYCSTYAANPPATSCAYLVSLLHGQRGDVPLAGQDFNADGIDDPAYYRPATGVWSWKASWQQGSAETQRTLGGPGQEPLPGLYDADNRTDLVVYDPSTATFKQRMSQSCNLVQCWLQGPNRPFDANGLEGLVATPGATGRARSGAFPVRGMYRRVQTGTYGGVPLYEPRLGFAVYAPFDVKWHVMWDPINSSAILPCAWGAPGVVPLGGIGTDWRVSLSSSGLSTMTYYDATDDAASGSLRFKTSTPGACSGQTSSVQHASWKPKSMAFAVRDMYGDGLPEILIVQPNTAAALIVRSETGYEQQTPIQIGTELAVIL